MNGPTLYERWMSANVFDPPQTPMVFRSRVSGRWWAWGANLPLLTTIHDTHAEAIAYATGRQR